MAFYQLTTIFDTTYSVHLPPYYTKWMRHFDFLSFEWDELIGVPAACVASGYKRVLILTAVAPLIFLASMFVVFTLRAGYSHITATDRLHDERTATRLRVVLSDGLLATAPFCLLITFACVPSVSANIFRAWSCQRFGSTPTASRFYMRADLSIECYESAAHSEAVEAAIVLMVLWPIGTLLLYMVLLLCARRSILNRTPTRLVRSTAFLHRASAVQNQPLG